MVEVGIRELKSRLSHYLQLMEAGETIAIKMRERIIGFLTNMKVSKKKPHEMSLAQLKRKVEQLKTEGFLIRGGVGVKLSRFKPIKLKGNLTASEMIRDMRDEDL